MSIIFRASDYVFINHKAYVDNLYKNVFDDLHDCSFEININLFSIVNGKEEHNRKRTVKWKTLQEETLKVQELFHKFKLQIIKEELNSNDFKDIQTTDVRQLSRQLFESTVFDHVGTNGGNTSDSPLKCKIKGEEFLIPPKSRFFCGCVKEQTEKLKGKKFDILIADPPWWNKYIRRLKNANEKLSYTMMYNEDIASIPVKDLLADNCLIAVWCTNSPSNIDAIKNIIFPQWGITYVTTWYWLKVAIDIEPICAFGAGCKKQPYERIILGRKGNIDVPESMLIVSVPSALHSHKPPLLDILKPLIGTEDPQILELFARYLLPNTISIGFEPLKWQHISLYEKYKNK